MNTAFSAKVKDIIMVNVGIVIVAAAVFFFQVPSHVAVSSVSGLAIGCFIGKFMAYKKIRHNQQEDIHRHD